jgi:hypothetical protein
MCDAPADITHRYRQAVRDAFASDFVHVRTDGRNCYTNMIIVNGRLSDVSSRSSRGMKKSPLRSLLSETASFSNMTLHPRRSSRSRVNVFIDCSR